MSIYRERKLAITGLLAARYPRYVREQHEGIAEELLRLLGLEFERICEHGIGHPIPVVHGCDGCCREGD